MKIAEGKRLNILAIDPGHTLSAYVRWNGERAEAFSKLSNVEIMPIIDATPLGAVLAIERVQSMGMAVGEEVFETVRWEARFAMRWGSTRPLLLVPRLRVKMHHCNDSRAKDPNIRQAILDRFGGREAAMGLKKTPGPLYGVSGDVWSALAIALAVHDVGELHGWNLDVMRDIWLKQKPLGVTA